ncbi:Carboxypeptidase A4 [Holothuria leucospilota]|uniref:Carboxypeptidase A4 n=1 Tax=Holothuria leucospilota TaxID=206669 RepID=A0A9Q0YBZ6_HOLLE|nr:Carboxypeptidase A4 [Holothuria leucospilota]
MALLNLYFYLALVVFGQQMSQGRFTQFQRKDDFHQPFKHPDKITGSTAGRRDYSGYKVLRVTPSDSNSYNFLESLTNQYDFWKRSNGLGDPADILVSVDERQLLISKLKDMGCDVTIMIDDVKSLIQNQMKGKRRKTRSSEFDYNNYHRLGEIIHWIKDFTADNRKLVAKKRILNTYHGRHVYQLRISSNLRNKTKPIFLMIGATHAREWISPATMMYVANFLVSSYDPERTDNLIDTMEFNIVPVLNQDGYRFSWKRDRMWRKTRNPNPGSKCKGTDANRNYDSHWGTGGSSASPCDQMYMGYAPNSTIEIRSLQNHILSIKERVKIFMDVHSYGQYLIYPYGYSLNSTEDEEDLRNATQAAADAIEAVHGELYIGVQGSRLYDVVSGTSADWGYDVAGIKYSLGIELRDYGYEGFLLSPSQIRPTSEEFYAGCKAMVKYLQDNNEL